MRNSIAVSFLSVFVLSAFVMSGCDSAKPKNQDQQRQPIGMEGAGGADAPQDPPEQKEPEQTEDNTVTVKAEVGAGAKGHYGPPTGGPMDIITVPISAGFRTRERISFLLIDDAMNKFKAEHDRVPESHNEFMEKIVRAGNITLPPLLPGQEYLYDPKDGELKIRKPRN